MPKSRVLCHGSILALVIGFATLASSPSWAGSFANELALLLREHPEIHAREAELEAAKQGVRRAFGGYLPSVDAFGEIGPEQIDSPTTRDAGDEDWQEIREIAGIRLTQHLFDGFATPSAVRTARLGEEIAAFTLEGTRQAILFEGISIYIEVLRQHRLVDLSRVNEQTIMRQLHLEDERVQRGAGIAVDVLQAKSRLQVAKERRVSFEGGLHDAITRYIQVFGHAPDIGAMEEPVPLFHEIPATLDKAVQEAEDQNPAIDASLATVEVASEERRLARSDYFPEINVVAEANRQKDTDLIQGTRTEYFVVLQATWNLFNGFATTASVEQSAYNLRAARDNHMRTLREVDQEARLAWHEMTTSRTRVDLLENAVSIAGEVFDSRQRLRQYGRETSINVLDAQNELDQARINLTQAQGDYLIALFQLLLAMGRLNAGVLGLP